LAIRRAPLPIFGVPAYWNNRAAAPLLFWTMKSSDPPRQLRAPARLPA
jgi:hypothetical protein